MSTKLDIVNRAVSQIGGLPSKVRSDAITVRLEPDVAARVAAAAERDGRTVSSYVRKVLLDRLAERGFEK